MIIKSLEHLNLFSVKIAKGLSKSDNIFLFGEIGVGKTTFTRCLINYLQKKDKIKITDVLSPTFNLLYEYDLKNFKLMHYDLYRIKNIREIQQLDIFDENKKTVNIIEWPELIKGQAENRIELKFSHEKNIHKRKIEIKKYGKWKKFEFNEF